ncbi:OLC1v1014646C1 [Oldenlandia corymbosa var. corymbosa]|uniref:OLC1v1014646C1 n=1 Tax=Oldenlandia corymbosa var. corymbosa TaxID=529605 RepID=A0AAV1E4X5_OLDCO|nr:OLC1v1014646C1 [Oldenlandia corymbosa var. corymbosa]
MSKDWRMNRLAPSHASTAPRASRSNDSDASKLETSSPPSAEREWEETRCPICMDHPHNAVLLICSSREKGCRPYMCDTSYRHSNCLDQFRKSFPEAATVGRTNFESAARMRNQSVTERGRHRLSISSSNRSLRGQGVDIACPLCRGQILGWTVDEAARKFMNSKIRSCSLESCEFTGTYAELRKHARSEHPSLRPFEADPQRQSDWARLERQRDLGDTLSAYHEFDPDTGDLLGDDYLGPHDVLLGDLTPVDLNMGVQPEGDNLFDLLSGFDLESDDSLGEGASALVDLSYELEFSFSFLNELSVCPWDIGSPVSRSSSSNLFDMRRRRPRSRSVDRRETISPRRNASRRSRHRPYYSPRRDMDEGL